MNDKPQPTPDGPSDAQPRWLTDEEMTAWLALIGVLVWLPAALDDQLRRDAGISHFEYMVLAVLSESPQFTARMNELAALANGSPSRLSHVVARLEQRGWVRRSADLDNARFTLATLTDAGWSIVVATAPGHVDAVRRYVFDALTPAQVRQLREIGRRVRRAIKPEGDWAVPRVPPVSGKG